MGCKAPHATEPTLKTLKELIVIKAVLFDIGGVLSRFVSNTNRTRWEKRLGVPEGTLDKVIFDSPVARKGFTGQATDEEVWKAVRERFGLTADETSALYQDYWQDEEWDPVLLDYIRALRPHYYTGVISDALPGARREPRVLAHVNDSLFDVILFSGEVGVMKPDPIIFDLALSTLKVQRGEAVFIDDGLHKVEGARRLGMHGVHFQTREQALAELDALLVRE
jgi:putative hydrolase of the HAD superfamily